MNALYTLFDLGVAAGRVLGIIALSLLALGFFSVLLLEAFLVLTTGAGGLAAWYFTENPPEFLQELLSKK